ncbi:MAG: class I SAM-dependent methyltransferase [Coriobacteriia bacterium]|nr:class I SAM-dependent methyltransferase [Coriobacteriia bacterium]
MDERISTNHALWEGWTDIHVGSAFYDVAGFVADPPARPLDRVVRGVVGDVAGKRVVHLQCHIGLDTVRFALMGASRVMGVDFSPKALEAARALAAAVSAEVEFVESDVTALVPAVPESSFDVAFTSYGTISWLPELTGWAAGIASRLAPGGVFHIVDMHPALWVFDDEAAAPPLTVRYPYFDTSPLYFVEEGSYADPSAPFRGESYSWQHTFEEIVTALIGAGLVIESLREYPVMTWPYAPFMVRDDEGFWRMPAEAGDVPLMFSISARKPA